MGNRNSGQGLNRFDKNEEVALEQYQSDPGSYDELIGERTKYFTDKKGGGALEGVMGKVGDAVGSGLSTYYNFIDGIIDDLLNGNPSPDERKRLNEEIADLRRKVTGEEQ